MSSDLPGKSGGHPAVRQSALYQRTNQNNTNPPPPPRSIPNQSHQQQAGTISDEGVGFLMKILKDERVRLISKLERDNGCKISVGGRRGDQIRPVTVTGPSDGVAAVWNEIWKIHVEQGLAQSHSAPSALDHEQSGVFALPPPRPGSVPPLEDDATREEQERLDRVRIEQEERDRIQRDFEYPRIICAVGMAGHTPPPPTVAAFPSSLPPAFSAVNRRTQIARCHLIVLPQDDFTISALDAAQNTRRSNRGGNYHGIWFNSGSGSSIGSGGRLSVGHDCDVVLPADAAVNFK